MALVILLFVSILVPPSSAAGVQHERTDAPNILIDHAHLMNEDATVTIAADLDSPKTIELVNDLLADESVQDVVVYDLTLLENENVGPTITPRAVKPPVYAYYRITGVKNGSDLYGANRIATANAKPGVTISINSSESVARSYSVTGGVSAYNAGFDLEKLGFGICG